MSEKHRFETRCLHAGQRPDPATGARAVPVHRTTSYVFEDSDHAARLFSYREPGNIYTRMMNPTQDVMEKRMAAMEGGGAALALASGTSAIFYSIINICSAGEEIVSANNLYGGTYTMFDNILPQFDIRTRFVDPRDPENFDAAVNENTRAIFAETIGNPSLDVTDIAAVSKIAQKHHVPLIIDGTFTTPYLLRPIEHGANIVVNSATKWIGGHGTGIGGIVIDGANFDWTDPKFTLFNTPDPSNFNMRFATDLGENNPVAFVMRMRMVALRNLGACISPDNAWIFLQGMETLPLRMQRHCENAMAAARHLKQHPGVSWVRYPGLEDDPSYPTAASYLKNGFGAMVVFGIKGGRDAGRRFIDRLELFSHLANVGDAKSLALHPASTTHSQLTEDQQVAAGVRPDMVRLSIGIEHIDDIIADLDRALKG
ncbi:MAG: O-acetylhomoserine aminocarboxypropyltransferase/cysteine synthase [Desulfobacterales bacterium]|nr:O-acetylhomoserine aminocarboxypropyltransferase/cysteine synthase [Desulfobacterales bacterium]MBS3754537.1 O-acetylhomoserine aminocarboxypropyltransferase/cysteine synthase [Desulfobacterales bacterium]